MGLKVLEKLVNPDQTDECYFRGNRGKSGHMSYEVCLADKPYERKENYHHSVMIWCASAHDMVRFKIFTEGETMTADRYI